MAQRHDTLRELTWQPSDQDKVYLRDGKGLQGAFGALLSNLTRSPTKESTILESKLRLECPYSTVTYMFLRISSESLWHDLFDSKECKTGHCLQNRELCKPEHFCFSSLTNDSFCTLLGSLYKVFPLSLPKLLPLLSLTSAKRSWQTATLPGFLSGLRLWLWWAEI